ncbi:MAG: hypothetical protein KA314_04900 [Chloroflexi bacterium]|nr:hypothetical protein [Chloroflexota bacterium]
MAKRNSIPAKTIKALLAVLPKHEVEWLRFYQDETTFEPMHLEDLIDGSMTFEDAFKSNVNWFESWSSDVLNQISHRPDADPDHWPGRGSEYLKMNAAAKVGE